MIEIKNLAKAYTEDRYVLKNVNLVVRQGEYIVITGESGCGKSTLLNILGLLDSRFTGELWLNGANVAQCSDEEISKIRNKNIGFIFQAYNLINDMTVLENICLPLIYAGMGNTEELLDAVYASMDRFNIGRLSSVKAKRAGPGNALNFLCPSWCQGGTGLPVQGGGGGKQPCPDRGGKQFCQLACLLP